MINKKVLATPHPASPARSDDSGYNGNKEILCKAPRGNTAFSHSADKKTVKIYGLFQDTKQNPHDTPPYLSQLAFTTGWDCPIENDFILQYPGVEIRESNLVLEVYNEKIMLKSTENGKSTYLDKTYKMNNGVLRQCDDGVWLPVSLQYLRSQLDPCPGRPTKGNPEYVNFEPAANIFSNW